MQQIELMKKLKVIISGGGTGGHIFPALAIAKAIENKVKDVEFLFVGAEDRMEMEKIPAAGYKIVGLWISGLQRNFSKRNLLFPFKVVSSLLKARKIVKQFKPDLAIGTGGYASGPLLFAAANKGVPSLIQEQNSYPGITNKILSKYVQKVCVAYDDMERFFGKEKLIITGNPIREDILGFDTKVKQGRELFSVDASRPTVLVVGGSLGARTINNAIAENIEAFKLAEVNLIWQTGISFQDKSQEIIKGVNVPGIQAHTFIKKMDLAYAAADVIVSRAGAIAISELCCVCKPIILVPSPNVSENHQYKNAQSLVNKNAALLVEDKDASRKLVSTLLDLVKDSSLQGSLSSNIKQLAVKNAADKIAKIALHLIK
jgi:UDP-N-acetylglucosamine--N-acetylmuramyl-(pentapeptide) pyrophosphoryl-undecaprenol N-acetylglucosamine transferase